jgi:lipopolysaccharide/colanic/teichoic acid biosynthesis glycosyltransferase
VEFYLSEPILKIPLDLIFGTLVISAPLYFGVRLETIMLRRRIGVFFLDLVLLVGAFFFALALRDNMILSLDRIHNATTYMWAMLAAAFVIIPLSGVDRMVWRLSSFRDYTRTVWAVLAIVLTACAIAFAYDRMQTVSRSLPILHFMLAACALVGTRVLVRSRDQIRRARKRSSANHAVTIDVHDGTQTVLIVGLNSLSELYARFLQDFAPDTVHVAGLVGKTSRHVGRLVGAHKVLGTPEDIEQIIRDLEVHGVFVKGIIVTEMPETLSSEAYEALLRLECSTEIEVDFLADKMGLARTAGGHAGSVRTNSKLQATPDLASSAISFSTDELTRLAHRSYWKIKRVLDFCVALVLLVLLAPVALVIGILVLFDVGWPLVFWQVRPGRFGKPFKVYKFRTMRSPHAADGTRIPDDERVSVIGEFIRRTRLDELPQLLNILAGQMSFVGPRPLLPVDQPKSYSARLLARPGLTGWAQVVGGREISAADKAMLDVWYVQNASLMLDIRIMLATIPMVVFGERMDHREIERVRQENRRQQTTRRTIATPA